VAVEILHRPASLNNNEVNGANAIASMQVLAPFGGVPRNSPRILPIPAAFDFTDRPIVEFLPL
jgi:hypothetical protein